MEKILLIVSDWNLRQLYHEELLSKRIEVVPVENICDAMVLLVLSKFRAAVLFVDYHTSEEAEVFLRLRDKYESLRTTLMVVLTSETFDATLLAPEDMVFDPLQTSMGTIIETIKRTLAKN